MSVALSQAENLSVIRLDGVIDIAVASELKASLVEALETGREIHFTLDAAIVFDVTAFQLLWSAQREATQNGLKFTLTRELSEPIQSSIKSIGLDGLLVG